MNKFKVLSNTEARNINGGAIIEAFALTGAAVWTAQYAWEIGQKLGKFIVKNRRK